MNMIELIESTALETLELSDFVSAYLKQANDVPFPTSDIHAAWMAYHALKVTTTMDRFLDAWMTLHRDIERELEGKWGDKHKV